VTPLEFRRDFWHQKTSVPVLSYGVVCVILRLGVLVQCRLVQDRRTDGQTQDDSIYCVSIASRGKNCTTTSMLLLYSANALQRKHVTFSQVAVQLLQNNYTRFLCTFLAQHNRTHQPHRQKAKTNQTQLHLTQCNPTQPMGKPNPWINRF